MEHEEVSSGSICDRLPPLSSKYPWFLVQNLEDEDNIGNEFFSTLHDPLVKYECQIPEFLGRRIVGCFHGWLILSHRDCWSLCNPMTSKIIHLPPLTLKDGDDESIGECCLTAPPEDPTSVLLLTRCDASTFFFCQLDPTRKRMRWTESSYAEQLKRLTYDGKLVHSVASCDGKIYVLNSDSYMGNSVIQVEIVVNDREVMIQLLMFGACPRTLYCCCSGPLSDSERYSNWTPFLKGYSTDLFYIRVGIRKETNKICDVYLYKLDTTSIKWEKLECLKEWDLTGMICEDVQLDDIKDLEITKVMWEEMDDLKDAIFYVDLARYGSIFYNPTIASELRGYIHIRDEMDEILYIYHVKDRTITSFSMPSIMESTTHVFMWEGRLVDDHVEANYAVNSKQKEDEIVVKSIAYDEVELNKSCLLNIPFDVLEMIMEHCVGVDYLNFRAICKHCHLAAPLIQWSNATALTRLRNYSLNSPWLMVVDKNRRIITFTDPISGDNYFMKKSQVSMVTDIYCSRFGWLLFYNSEFHCLVFFNPFTSELRKLPVFYVLESLCFSAPPTSPDCIVVGFRTDDEWHVCVHLVNRESVWRMRHLDVDPDSICSSTFYGQDLYVLCTDGELIVFKDLCKQDYSCKIFEAKAPPSCLGSQGQYHLMKFDQHLLLVVVGEFGEAVELFKWTDSTDKWEEIDGVGKHMIYICGTTSLCLEAKTPEMENKIYFPQMDLKTDKILCYPLETAMENHMYYTYNGKTIEGTYEGFHGTNRPLNAHAWIEPTWC